MRLFTDDQFVRLLENGKHQNRGHDWLPVAKLLLPRTGCVWLVSEIRLGTDRLYGYGIADYGTGHIHAGYIDLTDLEWLADPINNEPVRQDETFSPFHTMSVYLTAARMNGAIVDDEQSLQEALAFKQSWDKAPSAFEGAMRIKLAL